MRMVRVLLNVRWMVSMGARPYRFRCSLITALGVLAVVAAASAQERAAAIAVVEAERAFSRLSGKVGHIAAFLAYFSDDVVTFQPTPGIGKERLRQAADRMPVPPAIRLDWEPWFADAAEAGDLGYTTGPSISMETSTGKVVRTGWYFSIWKHDAAGWRVIADIGTETPPAGPLRPRTVDAADHSARGIAAAGRSKEDVLSLERALGAAISSAGLAKAYTPYLGASSRLHRDGVLPLVGAAAIAAYLASQPAVRGCRAMDAGISKSGDLAYSLGECDIAPASGTSPIQAGFLRVWKSGPRGWWLAADVVTR
jgi:ketosteroid isomerase-like protein